ncbi:B3 domain-containing protein REM9, partial [Bienertia sinuspersici]
MESFSNKNPHFFQPLLPGFQSNLSIPKSFLKYLGKEMKENVDGKLAMLRNNRADRIWMVKVGFDENDKRLYIEKGWKKFCEDYDLQIGDFLVFMHHQNLVFDVFVFDPSMCERPYPSDHHQPTKPTKKADSSSLKINNPAKK